MIYITFNCRNITNESVSVEGIMA